MKRKNSNLPLVWVVPVVLITSMSCVSPSEAQETMVEVDCWQNAKTQLEMSTCSQRAAEASASKLDALVDELRDQLGASQSAELEILQRQWTQMVELDCKWESAFFQDGSVAPMVYGNCLTSARDQRIQRLKIFLCEGKGMTGDCVASQRYN